MNHTTRPPDWDGPTHHSSLTTSLASLEETNTHEQEEYMDANDQGSIGYDMPNMEVVEETHSLHPVNIPR